MIYGFEKYVGVEPYKDRAIETKSEGTKRQFSYMVSKNLLVPLKVVYPSPDHHIWPGDYVFVKHEDLVGSSTWAKDIEVEIPGSADKRTIMVVPLDRILLVQRDTPPEVK